MKKLLIALLMFVGITYSQTITGNPPQLPRIPQDATGARGAVILNYDPNTGTYSGGFGAGSQIRSNDTLSGVNDTIYIRFGGRYFFGFLTVRDASDSNTDTLSVARYDSTTGAYTTAEVALKDLYINSILTDNTTVVPGQGLTKMYYINEPYPSTYKVYWKYGANKAGRTAVITSVGKN